MNIGYVKLHRSLHGSFHQNYKTDYRCWQVYVHLLENAFWKDGEKYKAGQVKTTMPEIADGTLLPVSTVRSSIRILLNKGHIDIDRASKWCNSGCIFTIRNDMQMTCKQHANDMQMTCISDENEKQKECFEKANDMQMTCKQHANDMTTEKKKEERRKKKEGSYINTGCEGVIEIGAHLIDATHQSTPSMPKKLSKSSEIWEAYKAAFMARYNQEPKRNAKVNALACQLHDRLGNADAIEVVKFYLTHNNAWYLRTLHSLDQCVKDCEKLYVEWKKNDYVRTADVQAAERLSDNESILRTAMDRFLERQNKNDGK